MSLFSHLNESSVQEANEFRVGVLGPESCGKSSIVAKLHNITEYSSATLCDKKSNSSVHLNKVMCVPVRQGQPLGIKIVPSKTHPTMCCVHSILPGDMHIRSQQSAIESDGRIAVGDLLVAVAATSLVNKSPFEIISILKATDYDADNHLLITFLRPGQEGIDNKEAVISTADISSTSSDMDSSVSSCNSNSSNVCLPVPIDHPTVLLTSSYFCYTNNPSRPRPNVDLTSYHMLPHSTISPHCNRPGVVEIVDLPGHDPQLKILREWLPRLDAMVLVYSCDSTSSLLVLERSYLRLITKLYAKEVYELPIVVVCNKADDIPFVEDSDENLHGEDRINTKFAEQVRKRDSLISEGRTMAEAWGAPFFVTSCVSGSSVASSSFAGREPIQKKLHRRELGEAGVCLHGGFEYIFEAATQQSLLHNSVVGVRPVESSAPLSNISSFLNFLPFVSECLSTPLESNHLSSRRKVHKIHFSTERDEDYGGEDDSFSTAPLSDDDGSCDSDHSNGSCCSERYGRSTSTPTKSLVVMKKTGHTHDVWKLNYSGEHLNSLGRSAREVEKQLTGSQIVGRE